MYRCLMLRGLSVTCGLLILALAGSALGNIPTAPVFKPTLDLSAATSSIHVDGILNDSAWSAAARTDRFVEIRPGDNSAPDVVTKAWATYTSDKLYVAFLCYDDPSTIRSTLCQRDQPETDDMVMLSLDTYGNGSWAYQLMVNPHGIQRDQLWSISSRPDVGFNLIWESAAQRTDSGYQVEIAIPFSSLRFPDADVQQWRIDLQRIRPRETYRQYAWSARDRNQGCELCQYGTIQGISDVKPGAGVELLPSFIGYRSGERLSVSEFQDHDAKGEMSLSGKYTTPSDIIIEAAVNPDFSQIEADATQIDVNSTFALFFPERRPYFNEGSDIFLTMFNSFYTRTVADPSFTAKITTRQPRTTFGLLTAVDENSPYLVPVGDYSLPTINAGRSVVNVLRGTQAIGNGSQVGVMLTDRRFRHDGSGSVLSGDYFMRLTNKYSINGQYIVTHTAELNDPNLTQRFSGITFDDNKHTVDFDGESFWGTAFIQQAHYNSEHLNWTLDYNQVSPSYRTLTGYDPVNNHRTLSFGPSYTIRPASGPIEEIQPGAFLYRRWEFDGSRLNAANNVNCNTRFRFAQTNLFVAYRDLYESFAGSEFGDLHMLVGQLDIHPHKRFGTHFEIYSGTAVTHFLPVPEKANELTSILNLSFKPIDRLTLDIGTTYYSISDRDADTAYADGFVSRSRLQFQANTRLSLRLIAEYDDFQKAWSIDPMVTYRLNPFSVFYAGSNMYYMDWPDHPNQINSPSTWRLAQRQFFMKLQYLFQV